MSVIVDFLRHIDSDTGASLLMWGDRLPVVDFTYSAPPVQYMRVDSAMKPTPSWEYTDRAAHVHRWHLNGDRVTAWELALPTLVRRQEQVECDGSCGGVCEGDGYSVAAWYCAECGERVEPQVEPDYELRAVGFPVVVGCDRLELTVVVDTIERVLFHSESEATLTSGTGALQGRAWVTNASSVFGEPPLCKVEFSPVATRAAA